MRTKYHTDNTNVSGLPLGGIAIGVMSFAVLLSAAFATFVFKANPVLCGALWFIGDLGVGLGLALIWAGERGISLSKLIGFVTVMLLLTVGIGAIVMFGMDSITDTFNLNTPAGDSVAQVLFLFGIIVPWIVLFVAGAKWIQRRPQD